MIVPRFIPKTLQEKIPVLSKCPLLNRFRVAYYTQMETDTLYNNPNIDMPRNLFSLRTTPISLFHPVSEMISTSTWPEEMIYAHPSPSLDAPSSLFSACILVANSDVPTLFEVLLLQERRTWHRSSSSNWINVFTAEMPGAWAGLVSPQNLRHCRPGSLLVIKLRNN